MSDNIIDIDVEDAVDFTPASDGEHKLEIVSAEKAESKRTPGNWMIKIRLELKDVEGEMVQDVYHNVMLPREGQDDKAKNATKLRLRDFCRAFGVTVPFNIEEDLPGCEGFAILATEEDLNGNDRSVVKRFVVPA
jgi:hypothetical protein